jgi:hypothetical protein
MIRRALSLYRRHFAALVVTGALAIAPTSLLEGGSLYAVLPRLETDGGTRAEKEARPRGDAARLQRFNISQLEPTHPLDAIRTVLPLLYQTFWGTLLLAIGAWLALAALSAAVFAEDFSPAHAWHAALTRLGPLFGAILLSGLLIAVGSVFFLVPGIVLAVGLAFSVPAVMQERLAAWAALHRSWHLARDFWPGMLAALVLLIGFSALASALAMLVPEGPLRAVIATGVRCLLWPLPLLGLALAYRAAREPA